MSVTGVPVDAISVNMITVLVRAYKEIHMKLLLANHLAHLWVESKTNGLFPYDFRVYKTQRALLHF